MFNVLMQSRVIVETSDDEPYETSLADVIFENDWPRVDFDAIITALESNGLYESSEPEHGIYFSVTLKEGGR